jgi:hypothetical protein
VRTTIVLICILAITCAARAQNKASSWDHLNTLQPGEKIQISAMSWKKVNGDFVSVSEAAITVQTKEGSRSIQRQDVRRVKRMKSQHRLRNAWIGAGLGAGVGAGIGAATYNSQSCASKAFCLNIVGRGGAAGIGGVIGLLGGGLVGALSPSHETLYSTATP